MEIGKRPPSQYPKNLDIHYKLGQPICIYYREKEKRYSFYHFLPNQNNLNSSSTFYTYIISTPHSSQSRISPHLQIRRVAEFLTVPPDNLYEITFRRRHNVIIKTRNPQIFRSCNGVSINPAIEKKRSLFCVRSQSRPRRIENAPHFIIKNMFR